MKKNSNSFYKRTTILVPLLLLGLALLFTVSVDTVSASPSSSLNTIYVNDSGGNDSADGSSWLNAKKTIQSATDNVNADGTVQIAQGIYSGTGNTNITINKNMKINGQSQEGTIINGTGINWIFHINSGINVKLTNLTFTNGTTTDSGGAIFNGGNLLIENCNFTKNTASMVGNAIGGAIYNFGTLTVRGSTFTDNAVTFDGFGGAIFNGGNLFVENCTFTRNTAPLGGAIYNSNTLTVTGSTFTDNTAYAGGAIGNESNSEGKAVLVNFNRFFGNSAQFDSAVIYSNSIDTIDVRYNWWGSNNPTFSNLISGYVNYSPWIYMNISADPTSINNGGTSLITASFNNLYDGTTVTTLDPALGHIPDGTPVTFNTDLGSIGSKTIDKKTSNGLATATLTADETVGTAHLNAVTDAQTVYINVNINPKSSLYLTVTPNKNNPTAGDTVIYTLKVGNKGPDTAKDVVMTYVVPEGLEFTSATVDNGTYTYNATTRTITWTIGDVPVGDPNMWLSLHITQAGQYIINPQLRTSTYDPTLNENTQSLTVNAATQTTTTSITTVNAASNTKTVGMQTTGAPIAPLAIAVLSILGGLKATRRK